MYASLHVSRARKREEIELRARCALASCVYVVGVGVGGGRGSLVRCAERDWISKLGVDADARSLV